MTEGQPIPSTEPKEKSEFIRLIENHFGMTVEELQKIPLEEIRARAEARTGKPLQLISNASYIRNLEPTLDLISHEEVERLLDDALE